MTHARVILGFSKAAIVVGVAGLAAFSPALAQEKYASIVIDADTLETIHESYADEARYPASLTKVMTLYMLFDALNSGEVRLDEPLFISANAASQPASKLGLKAGSTITVGDAIKALVVKSANDAAVVVAERLGGTEERFAALMTVKARMLGLTDTRFYNASGLPNDRQVSTARDMARLADAMIDNHPQYYPYFTTPSFTWEGRTYRSHNVLIGRTAGVDGLKTGYTRASGFNLMTSAVRDDKRLIVVVLGGNTARARDNHVEDLLEAAYVSVTTPGTTREIREAAFTSTSFGVSAVESFTVSLSEGSADSPLDEQFLDQ